MQNVRSVVRTLGALAAVFLAVAGPLIAAVPAVRASVSATRHQPLTIAITGMTPTIASPNSKVTVTGTLVNHTRAALPGIVVQARTSTSWFQYPAQMAEFTRGASPLPLQPAGLQYSVPKAVPKGATVHWSVSFQAGAFYYQYQFGVFPVEVRALANYGAYKAVARTFLPFWPGKTATHPKGLQVAWIWPLIDTPQQGACRQTLATSDLAGSVASGGRLSTLLGAGSAWAQKDDLTWDIDPALLSDVSLMTKTYFTQGGADCTDRSRNHPSAAASAWLSQLKTSTAGSPAFLAPYGDVDVAALSHSGLDGSIQDAYRVGRTVASQILPDTFGKTGPGAGGTQVLQAAWPPAGQADAGVLTSLAHDGGISTVVLSSKELSSSSVGEDALARTVSGVGSNMSVLSANARITSLLGTASASASPSAQFALTQDFLAQTAMIAAELPARSRSLVVAPPPNWDPSPAEADALLRITDRAPWLHPTGLSTLAATAAKLPSATQVRPKQVSHSELSDGYMDNIAAIAANLTLFEGLLYQPPARELNGLNAALAVTESSAWRGSGAAGGWRAAGQLAQYLQDSERKVRLIVSKKILLTGQSGKTAVSVLNGLGQPIQVRVTASSPHDSGVHVGPFHALLTVQAGETGTVTMPVRSATLGTTTLHLQLATRAGRPLTWKEASQPLSVEVTTFGRSLLIVIGGALGILVLTSAYRLRRKRLTDAESDGTADETAEAGGTG